MKVLSMVGNINQLPQLSLSELKSLPGIKNAKALRILGCIELSKRLQSTTLDQVIISSNKDVYDFYASQLIHEKQEHFRAMYLDSKHRVIREKMLFLTVDGRINFELYRGDPFFQFDPDHLERRTDILTRVEGLGELLGDGTSTSLAGVAAEESLDKDSRETLEIDTRMSVKTFVLCSYCSMNDIRRQVLVVDERSVLYMKGSQDLSVFSDDLSGKVALRILQFLE